MADLRCWRYREGGDGSPSRVPAQTSGKTADGVCWIGRLFDSPADVPEGEGWTDSPAKIGKRAAPPSAPEPSEDQPETTEDEPGEEQSSDDEAEPEDDLDAEPESELDMLRRQAAALGLTVNRRWREAALRKAIAEHKGKPDDDGA
jgi:hypothetical protein